MTPDGRQTSSDWHPLSSDDQGAAGRHIERLNAQQDGNLYFLETREDFDPLPDREFDVKRRS